MNTALPAADPATAPASIPLALCADDYAQHAGVDSAIVDLLARQRLSATSCMSTAPRWGTHSAPALRELAQDGRSFDIGLHFNLTEDFGQKGSADGLGQTILLSHMHLLGREKLYTAWQKQLDAFEGALQCAPDFIDGHQHVHQLPQVRSTLFAMLEQRYGRDAPWLRSTIAADRRWGGKCRVLELLGGAGFARELRQRAWQTNHGFGGVYGFDLEQDAYAAAFAAWLRAARAGMLIMCHPGQSLDAHDPISAQRLLEYAFFSSPQFPALLQQHGVHLVRLSGWLKNLDV